MSSNGTERPLAPASGPMRCARCDCTFKRSEHLKRHERIHDTNKRFACSKCQKLFTRSDILRRHEATHTAVEQTNGERPSKTRACTECARSRERCTKSEPCQRCTLKGLRCTYPQPRSSMRQSSMSDDQGGMYHATSSPFQPELGQGSPQLRRESMAAMPLGATGHNVGNHSPAQAGVYAPFHVAGRSTMAYDVPQPMITDYHDQQLLQPSIEFPMNWLPPDESLAIDYESIVGLGVSSLDFFSLPETSGSELGISKIQNEQHVSAMSIGSHVQMGTIAKRNIEHLIEQQPGRIWSSASPGTLDRYTSSQSPHSVAHTLSPSAAPGGLYATSGTGARMPCTVRARRPNRLLTGACAIPAITDTRCNLQDISEVLAFPNTSHLSIDHAATPAFVEYPGLSESMYEKISGEFHKLCADETCGFSTYSNTEFPSISALSMLITLYFENFDEVIPILHEQVTRVNDHWILALGVAAIGCHYAEADEFSRCVEPMHEFLRRAIRIEFNSRSSQSLGSEPSDVALAQAMTLNHIGMLYCGSPRMLRYARSQHSSLVDMARSIAFSLLGSSSTRMDARVTLQHEPHHVAWHDSIAEECKRRIGYAVWMIDCMAAYQFSQQPSMPPDLVPVPLPDDRLWSTNSPEELAMRPAPLQETPSFQTAIKSLFQEKSLNPELGQFSRIILLHGVYREVFYIKDCLDGPLGGWVPSLHPISASQHLQSHPNCASGGQELLSTRRNAALDCLDVLHWAANATIAQAAGAEHPAVLHLHLARTVILSPLAQIRTFADSIVAFTQDPPTKTLDTARRKQIIDIERDIIEWAQRDQCKARLAVLHSGCLFWHIRRYSIRAFHEPLSVFLATLTLWAFSSYASRTTAPSSPHQNIVHESSAEDIDMSQHTDTPSDHAIDDPDLAPTFIHLDRPNDDEMVQFFVRNGSAMRIRANITGVGDIYATNGPSKILKEGLKVLSAVSTAWGRTTVYANTLQVLEQVASGRPMT